jgi:very-short-patch-repair endonuclease
VAKVHSDFAKRLRRNQTDAERVLWFRLRDRRLAGWKFKRQAPIDRYVVDFFCAEARLIIEIDGGQHDRQRERDSDRTAALEATGYLVLRFWNNEVMQNTAGVLETVMSTVNRRDPNPLTPPLSPPGRGSPPSPRQHCQPRGAPEPAA